MSKVLDSKNVVEGLISSYEARVESVGAMLDSTDLVLSSFQEALIDTKEEREKVNTELRDILAKNEHLRRKDFDNMMQGILTTQAEREKEIKSLLKQYLNGHKEMAQVLRENLAKFKGVLTTGEAERIKEFQGLIKEILNKQEDRKNEVTDKLKKFQKGQEELNKALKELLSKGTNLRIRDLKSMLKEFDNERNKRLALQKKRKEEITEMLARFKKKRSISRPSSRAINIEAQDNQKK